MFGTQGIHMIIGDTTPMILEYLNAEMKNGDQPEDPDDPNGTTPKRGRMRKPAIAA